jgi:hypothetical protein
VFNDFKRARNNFLIFHDCDLQRWAKNKARELDFEFKASNSWLSRFKKINGIVYKKATKIVSTNYVQDQETIEQSAKNFSTTQSKLCKVSMSQTHSTVTSLVLITYSLQVTHFLKKMKELHFFQFHYYK